MSRYKCRCGYVARKAEERDLHAKICVHNYLTGLWIRAESIHANPMYYSYSECIKPILLALPDRSTAVIGWFFAGRLNEFRMDGSPSQQHPTHWMPLPEPPHA